MQVVARLDLVRLANSLRNNGLHTELVRAIDRAAAAGSIRQDLHGALASLEQIVRIQDRREEQPEPFSSGHEEITMTGALFTQAVILYARATATTGGRPKLLGEAKLTPIQRATHKEAMKLRDTTIAHFGRGEVLVEGPLVKEAVILSLFQTQTGPKKQVGVYTTRAQHKAAFAARLAALLRVRLAELAARHQQLFNEADAALEAAVKTDPALGRSLPLFEFDVDAFCASPEAAAHMRAQLDSGSMEDMDYAVAVPKP